MGVAGQCVSIQAAASGVSASSTTTPDFPAWIARLMCAAEAVEPAIDLGVAGRRTGPTEERALAAGLARHQVVAERDECVGALANDPDAVRVGAHAHGGNKCDTGLARVSRTPDRQACRAPAFGHETVRADDRCHSRVTPEACALRSMSRSTACKWERATSQCSHSPQPNMLSLSDRTRAAPQVRQVPWDCSWVMMKRRMR